MVDEIKEKREGDGVLQGENNDRIAPAIAGSLFPTNRPLARLGGVFAEVG